MNNWIVPISVQCLFLKLIILFLMLSTFFILLVRASLSGFWRWLLKCSEEKFVSASWSLIMLILTEYSIFHLSCIGQIYPGLSSFFGIKPHSFRSIGLENTNINTNLNTITLIKSATIYWSIIKCEGDFFGNFQVKQHTKL